MPPPLRASSTLEAIVGAVILLIAFFLAMEMLPRIAARVPDEAPIRAEADSKACVLEFSAPGVPPGEYLREYDWGEIAVTVRPYEPFSELREITFVSTFRSGNRTTVFRMLAADAGKENQPPQAARREAVQAPQK